MKRCTKCQESKDVNEFYLRAMNSSERFARCKECCRVAGRKYDSRPEVKAKKKEYKKTYNQQWYTRFRAKARAKRLRVKFPEKYEARKAVAIAVQEGKLEKLPCEVCGDVKVQGHHEDYSKQLEVKWLCIAHHIEADKKLKFRK